MTSGQGMERTQERRVVQGSVTSWISDRPDLELVLAFYFCTVVIRLAVALLLGISSPLSGDEPEYYEPATHLILGQGYSHLWPDSVLRPSAYRVPGASVIFAVGLLAFGNHVESARLTAVLFGSLATPLMYLMARKIATRKTSIAAAFVCLIYPTWLHASGTILSEPFFIPLLLLTLIQTACAVRSPRGWVALAAGIACGAAGLVRPEGVAIALIFALYLIWYVGMKRAMLFIFGCALLVAPWVVRNMMLFEQPLLATEAGETLLGSNNPYVVRVPAYHGMWYSPWSIPEYRAAIEFDYSETDRNRIQRDIAWRYLKENPRVIPLLVFYKLTRWLTPITASGGAIRLAVLASYGSLLLFLAFGLYLRIFRRSAESDLALIWTLLMTIVTMVYWGNLTRGRIAVEIVWIPWGVIAASEAVKRLQKIMRRSNAESSL